MTVAYACDLNVYVCVNFGDKILLREEECKTRVNLNFFENGQNSKLSIQYRRPKISRSRMMKRISPLDSSLKI